MTYNEICTMHFQLISIYEKNFKSSSLYQKQIDYFKGQLFMYTEDIVQQIFVLNQLLKIYEKRREYQIQCCTDEYFARKSLPEEP